MPNEPSVKRDLKATADLLDALQNDPALLDDPDFIRRLSILRQKHEETTNFLARKIGAPELSTHHKTHQKVPKSEVKFHCAPLNIPRGNNNSRSIDKPINIPVRIAPAPPRGSSSKSTSSSSVSQKTTVREILSKVHEKYELFPQSLNLTSTMNGSRQNLNSNLARNSKSNSNFPPKIILAPNSNPEIVEESFLSDAISTTREVPTIVDEMVEISERHVAHGKNHHHKIPEIRLKIDKKRSKSMQNVAEPRNEYIPQSTVPKPFQLSLRKSTGNTYAKKFMEEMMEEKKKKKEEEDLDLLKNPKFEAKPVPKSTYIPTNIFATEQKYVEAMRKKIGKIAKAKFDAQNEKMVRSKSESNLASIKPLGYVPPSTYISPIPVKPNARSRSATTRSAILIQEATTPKGIKSHRHASNLTHNLRHGKCKIDVSSAIQHRRVSPPDFDKLHAKISEDYRKTNSKPSTVPIPFKFESRRSQSAHNHQRHKNCQEKEPVQFLSSSKNSKNLMKSFGEKRIPSTHAAQLREELSRSKVRKNSKISDNEGGRRNFWKEDSRKRISNFLGARSKTDEDIAIRTRRKIQQQQETTQEYMRQLAQMKQRVLNGPLIMEKQSALAQEHRLKRKFEARMKTTTVSISRDHDDPLKSSRKSSKKSSRRNSEAGSSSGGGTFVVEKEEYSEDFEGSESEEESSESSENSENTDENDDEDEEEEK